MSTFIKTDFWKSMSSTFDSNKHIITDLNWKTIEEKYNKFEANENKIPKIIHQIWLGSKIPDYYKKLTDSFKIINPDWEYKLWTDENIKDLDLVNRTLFDIQTNMGVKSDLLRYELLYKYGGIYADTDFECLKSLDDFLGCSFFCGLFFSKNPEIAFPNGLFGVEKNSKIMKDLVIRINKIDSTSSDAIMSSTGPYYFGQIVMKHFLSENKNDDIILLPTNFAYSLPSSTRFNITGIRYEDNKDLTLKYRSLQEAYLLHYWHVSWKV
jgi:mannosyltransferase OCH1-like enzyme